MRPTYFAPLPRLEPVALEGLFGVDEPLLFAGVFDPELFETDLPVESVFDPVFAALPGDEDFPADLVAVDLPVDFVPLFLVLPELFAPPDFAAEGFVPLAREVEDDLAPEDFPVDLLAPERTAVPPVEEDFDDEDFFVDEPEVRPLFRDVPLLLRCVVPATLSAAAPIAPAAAPLAAPPSMSDATSITLLMIVAAVPRDRELFDEDDFEPDEAPDRPLDFELLFLPAIFISPKDRIRTFCSLQNYHNRTLLQYIFFRACAYNSVSVTTNIIIVGAGPTGLALAAQLVRFGIDFIIVDSKEGTTPFSKAIGVQARTLEIYEQFGIGENLIAAGAIAHRAQFVVGGEVRGEATFSDKGMTAYPYVLLVEQGIHERILFDFLRARGKDVMWRTKLESFTQDEAGVTATVRDPDGKVETIEAKFMIGCDGAHSLVRRTLGLEFEGGTFERLFYVADVEIDWEFSHDALTACLAEHSVTAFFPMAGGDKHYRIVGTFPECHEKDPAEILYDEIERQIAVDTGMKLDITNVNWFSVYKVHTRHVNKFSVGRCFLAGDSAHIHTPVGAQGMNTGIQDGYNLAWKLALVLNANASTEILNTYNEERLPNARQLVQTTDRFFQLGANQNWLAAFLRTSVFPYVAHFAFRFRPFTRRLFPVVSQIGINYRKSSLSRTNGSFSVTAGDRMPYFLIDGSSVYDRLRDPTFHLLVFADGTAPIRGNTADLGGRADFHVFPLYPNIAEIFDTTKTFTVLLRPDNYIGYLGVGYSVEDFRDYWDKVR
ncbi:MAG: FAD-dependent monooxygenase [Pyrinomonadaceae bacterium]